MRELRPNKHSFLFPERWDTTNKAWRVYRTHAGIRSIAGDFTTKREAQWALKSLSRLPGEFTLEYIGKNISHSTDGGNPIG